jgi:hypothetical protein
MWKRYLLRKLKIASLSPLNNLYEGADILNTSRISEIVNKKGPLLLLIDKGSSLWGTP